MERYTILGRIGEGAHGVVFQATNNETGVVVALKKVALGRSDAAVANHVLREIKALKASRRPLGCNRHFVFHPYSSCPVLSKSASTST